MTIQKVEINLYNKIRNQIEKLLCESVCINFPDFQEVNHYVHSRCNDLARFIEEETATVFIASEQEKLAGWIWLRDIERMGKHRIHIAEIVVSENYKRKGVGSKLLKMAEKYAIDGGFDEMDLLVTASNKSAVAFYERASFVPERYQMCKNICKPEYIPGNES